MCTLTLLSGRRCRALDECKDFNNNNIIAVFAKKIYNITSVTEKQQIKKIT